MSNTPVKRSSYKGEFLYSVSPDLGEAAAIIPVNPERHPGLPQL
jgi:hypothetical protein